MQLQELLKDALGYPFKDLKRYLILLILFFGFILVIPGILACGYLLRIVEYSSKGMEEHPDFSDIKKLLLDGLKYIIISIIFGIIFYLVSGLILTPFSPERALTMIITILISVLVNSFYLMSLAQMAHEGQFKAAFEFKNIINIIQNFGWTRYLLFILVFSLIGELMNLFIEILSPYLINLGVDTAFGLIFIPLIFYTYLFIVEARYAGLLYRNN